MYLPYDSTMFVLIPAIILTLYAQYKVQSTFQRYLHLASRSGYTGAQVARRILDEQGLTDVSIEQIGGRLTDHYDPRKRVLRLSREVYYGNSLASLRVTAHETGHAIQHAYGYTPLNIRNAIVPIVNFSSRAAFIFIFAGLFFAGATILLDIGIYMFAAVVLFQLITLPVEFNASSRAVELLAEGGYVSSDEQRHVRKVLNAAALTYVASAATAISQLLRLLMIRDRRQD